MKLILGLAEGDGPLATLRPGLGLRRGLADGAGESGSLHDMALVHRDLGQLPEVLEHVYQGLDLAEPQQDGLATAYALNTPGSLLDELGEQPQAQVMFERALASWCPPAIGRWRAVCVSTGVGC